MEQEKRIIMAYTAGMIDGDGAIYMTKVRPTTPTSIIQVAMSHKKVIEFLFGKFGGKISMSRKLYSWSIRKKDQVRLFLDDIKEFLIEKRELALSVLSLDYQETKRLNSQTIQNLDNIKYYFKNQEEAFAYIAGFIDSDGHISIKKRYRDCENKKRHYPDYVLHIGCGGTDFRSTNFVAKHFGKGSLKTRPHKRCVNGKRLDFRIRKHDESREFLEKCLPFLIAKKEHAEIVLKYIDGYEAKMGGNDRSIPQKQIEHREFCYQQIKKLQIRGCDLIKPHLIDSEAQKQGDEAEPVRDRERLSGEDAFSVCNSLSSRNSFNKNSREKIEESFPPEMVCSREVKVTE